MTRVQSSLKTDWSIMTLMLKNVASFCRVMVTLLYLKSFHLFITYLSKNSSTVFVIEHCKGVGSVGRMEDEGDDSSSTIFEVTASP